MSAPSVPSKPQHSRHDTALIHGLSTSEVQALSEACIGSKGESLFNVFFLNGPYSKFRVGASLLLTSGQIIRGANVENAAYPVGTCAERTALGTAVVEGARRGDIRALAVATDISPPASPCGMCRQYIREFCEDGKSTVLTLEQLLPMSFGPESLPMH
ncbi:unnamed protein product, partial [Aureobasidium pullulans]